jgi:hypothetical protein
MSDGAKWSDFITLFLKIPLDQLAAFLKHEGSAEEFIESAAFDVAAKLMGFVCWRS